MKMRPKWLWSLWSDPLDRPIWPIFVAQPQRSSRAWEKAKVGHGRPWQLHYQERRILNLESLASPPPCALFASVRNPAIFSLKTQHRNKAVGSACAFYDCHFLFMFCCGSGCLLWGCMDGCAATKQEMTLTQCICASHDHAHEHEVFSSRCFPRSV